MSVTRRKVLIVDDNPDAVAILTIMLKRAGHETYHAVNGSEALALARRLRPDFVFLDIGLPQINGLEVARELRRDPGFAGVRIIAISGLGQETVRKEAQDAGFDQYLVKPIDLAFVESLLGH